MSDLAQSMTTAITIETSRGNLPLATVAGYKIDGEQLFFPNFDGPSG